jgi:hypothetical protein
MLYFHFSRLNILFLLMQIIEAFVNFTSFLDYSVIPSTLARHTCSIIHVAGVWDWRLDLNMGVYYIGTTSKH